MKNAIVTAIVMNQTSGVTFTDGCP
jgi:hypothetical protein